MSVYLTYMVFQRYTSHCILVNHFKCGQLSMEGVDPEWVDQIPGRLSERRSPLGELHWIFTAIMDAIAWNTFPSQLFQKLFRQDLLMASLFRNFLLADRILRYFQCTFASFVSIAAG